MFRGMWRPRVDVPEFTRCCFCLPLRHGLLVWGYFKLMIVSMFVYLLVEDVIRLASGSSYNVPAIMVLFLCLLLVDLIFNIMFIVAGHMKHQQIFRMYYYYSIVFMGLFVSGYIIMLSSYFYSFRRRPAYVLLWLTLDTLYVAIPVVLVQTYVTLMVRSEARKLAISSNYQFVNTATESGYTMGLNNVDNAAAAQ